MESNRCFADTWFWIALFSKRDQDHQNATKLAELAKDRTLVTSEMVLTELMNMYADKGKYWRNLVARYVEQLQSHPSTVVVEQDHAYFTYAMDKYKAYSDKHWSLTDCSSFVIMDEYSIQHALTNDRHFVQAGFTLLAVE